MKRVLVAAVVVAAAACGPAATHHYYTLTGQPPGTRFSQPFPVKVKLRDLEMRRTYRRDELVLRSDANELTFSRTRRWSEPPQRMISSLVREQVRRSSIAAELQDESSTGEPDYILSGEVEAIEQLGIEHQTFAHLAVTLRLARAKDDATVWTYHIDAKRPSSGSSTRSTVRVLSELLAQETDKAISDLGRYLIDPSSAAGPASASAPASMPFEVAATQPAPEPGLVVPGDGTPLNDLPQVQRDETDVPPGMGALFAPTLSDGDREPRVSVYQNGDRIAEGQLGRRIVLMPGDYEVRVGSGAISQQLVARARVVDGKTTVLPPTWAALEVSVVDQTAIPFRGTYELIRMSTREDFGLGFGVDETQGEIPHVWVLPPGLYKLIRSGGTYHDRTDFATARLEAGRFTRFTLVVDPADGTFHGAGENDPDLFDVASSEEEAERKWLVRAVIGGTLSANHTDEPGVQQGWKLSFRVFADGSLRLFDGPHVWATILQLEEGQTRVLATSSFQNDFDRLYLNSIYTYQLLPWFGPYVRVGMETKLLPRYADFDTPRDVEVLDSNGAVVDTLTGVTSVELGSTFAPLLLIEGAGGNFRLLRTAFLELNLRLGFGAHQTFSDDLFLYQAGTDGAPDTLVPVENAFLEGLEGTVIGLGRISRFITLSTELDGLLPVGGDNSPVYTWRNQLTLQLVSFISLNYRLNVTRDPNLGIGDEARVEHDVQLRFSYVLF